MTKQLVSSKKIYIEKRNVMKVGLFGTGAYGMALSSILSHNNVR